MADGRKHNNRIEVIEDDPGREISNEEHKRSYFFHSFKRLFGQEAESLPSLGDWSSLYHSNRLLNPEILTTPFTIEEVRAATIQLGSEKAPGPDGFSLIFFQTFWETVKEDIFNVFTDLYDGKLYTGPTDYSFVCLIPKKEVARKAKDF